MIRAVLVNIDVVICSIFYMVEVKLFLLTFSRFGTKSVEMSLSLISFPAISQVE